MTSAGSTVGSAPRGPASLGDVAGAGATPRRGEGAGGGAAAEFAAALSAAIALVMPQTQGITPAEPLAPAAEEGTGDMDAPTTAAPNESAAAPTDQGSRNGSALAAGMDRVSSEHALTLSPGTAPLPADADGAAGAAQRVTDLGTQRSAGRYRTGERLLDPGVAGVSVVRVDRDADRLDPAFRERLERVVARMRSEFGHEVSMVEGYREQARQNFLFEQGRERPGPVVTWTRESAHTDGRAADLIVDGRYDHPDGYARLAEIAREEGLATLGARDPGHVELAAESARSRTAAIPTGTGAAATPGGIAQVAQIAPLAAVAQVAQVAPVAQIAPSAAAPSTTPVAPGAEAAALEAPRLAVRTTGRRADSNGAGAEGEHGQGAPHTSPLAVPRGDVTSAPASVSTTDMAGRIGRIIELRDAAEAQPLSSVLLRLDDVGEGSGRIRVGLRGTSVEANITLSDPEAAGRLHARLDDLGRALREQGLDPAALRVQGAARSDLMERLGDVNAPAARLLRALESPASTGESAGSRTGDEPRRDPELDYHRSRREQRREKQA